MGFYVEVPHPRNKAMQLVNLYKGQIVPKPAFFADIPEDKALIVVVANEMFEAAGLAFCDSEFRDFTDPHDNRPKQFVLLDKELAHKLSGYSYLSR